MQCWPTSKDLHHEDTECSQGDLAGAMDDTDGWERERESGNFVLCAQLDDKILHMETVTLADQQKLTFIRSKWTLDAINKTY